MKIIDRPTNLTLKGLLAHDSPWNKEFPPEPLGEEADEDAEGSDSSSEASSDSEDSHIGVHQHGSDSEGSGSEDEDDDEMPALEGEEDKTEAKTEAKPAEASKPAA